MWGVQTCLQGTATYDVNILKVIEAGKCVVVVVVIVVVVVVVYLFYFL